MQRFSVFSYICRATAITFVVLATPALLSGCVAATYAPGPEFSSETHDYLRADDSIAYAECTAMCMEDSALALVTRTGCLEGCEEARTRFTLHDKAFTARQDCLDALLREDVMREKRIAEMKRQCDAKWSHVHNRKGCYLAAERFYAALTPGGVCGSDVAESTRYDEDVKRAREEAAKTPFEPEPASPPAETPAAKPAAEQTTPASAPTPEATPVTHATQPSGPLDPPPYIAPDQGPQPAPTPEIRDTPKYQKAPPVKRETPAAKPESKPAPSNAQPGAQPGVQSGPVPAEAPKNEKPGPAPKPAEEAGNAKPESPVPAKEPEPPMEARPQTNAPSESAPAPETEKPEPTQPVTAQPVTALPAPAETPPAPMRSPQASSPQTDSPKAEPPKVELPQVSEPLPESVPARREGPPVPGLNANRPLPPERENAPEQPRNSVLMPPVSSMLDKPYETPTIISPQIETN